MADRKPNKFKEEKPSPGTRAMTNCGGDGGLGTGDWGPGVLHMPCGCTSLKVGACASVWVYQI